jgi:hypothetical protein
MIHFVFHRLSLVHHREFNRFFSLKTLYWWYVHLRLERYCISGFLAINQTFSSYCDVAILTESKNKFLTSYTMNRLIITGLWWLNFALWLIVMLGSGYVSAKYMKFYWNRSKSDHTFVHCVVIFENRYHITLPPINDKIVYPVSNATDKKTLHLRLHFLKVHKARTILLSLHEIKYKLISKIFDNLTFIYYWKLDFCLALNNFNHLHLTSIFLTQSS